MPELGQSFKQALAGAVGNDTAVFDYGDIQDFSRIWGTDEHGVPTVLPDVNGKKAIIIVWDGRARQYHESEGGLIDDPGAQLLAPHLTPLDWALALSIKVLDGSALSEDRNFSVHIVDLTGKAHDEWALHMRFQLLVEMPWLMLHAPLLPNGNGKLADYRKGYQPILGSEGLIAQNGPDWELIKGASIRDYEGIRYQARLKYLARQWSASLTVSNDHHDIHNLIGPSVISGVEPKLSESPSIGALYRKMLWTGFLDGELPKKESSEALREELSAVGPLDIMAIDDEMHRGWHNVLQDLLGIDNGPAVVADDVQWSQLGVQGDIELFGCRYPSILDLLPNEVNQHYSYREFNSHPYPAEEGDPRPWMLVLDLRLHSGVKEVEWFRQLLEITKGIARADQESLAWPGFELHDEIDVVEAWLDKGAKREEAAYDIALSLFPRLCALRWPAVPILIFSGTGRRELISMLSAYGNLFLVSQKPNVLGGDAAGQIKAFRASFHHELQKAMRFVQVQRALLQLLTAPQATVGIPANGQHCHVVIAVDEAGSPTQAIGAAMLFAYGGNEDEARRHAYEVQELLLKQGVKYYERPPVYLDLPKATPGTDQPCKPIAKFVSVFDNVAKAINEASINHKIDLGFLRYSFANGGQNAQNGFTDETYLSALSEMTEILLAEIMPSIGFDWRNGITVSVWFPSKQSSAFPDAEQARQHALTYDFRYDLGRLNAETIGGWGSSYSVLLRALSARACFGDVKRKIRRLSTRKIPYWKDPGKTDPYQPALHWWCEKCNGSSYPNAIKQYVATPVCGRPVGGLDPATNLPMKCGGTLHADYTPMYHLVDEMINLGLFANGYEPLLSQSLRFNIIGNEATQDFLHAAKLYDRGRKADGFKLAYKHDFFINGLNTFGSGTVESRLRKKLAEYTKELSGNTLIDLAGLTTHLPESAPTKRQGGYKQEHRPDNKSKPKNNKGANGSKIVRVFLPHGALLPPDYDNLLKLASQTYSSIATQVTFEKAVGTSGDTFLIFKSSQHSKVIREELRACNKEEYKFWGQIT